LIAVEVTAEILRCVNRRVRRSEREKKKRRLTPLRMTKLFLLVAGGSDKDRPLAPVRARHYSGAEAAFHRRTFMLGLKRRPTRKHKRIDRADMGRSNAAPLHALARDRWVRHASRWKIKTPAGSRLYKLDAIFYAAIITYAIFGSVRTEWMRIAGGLKPAPFVAFVEGWTIWFGVV
jgi:hypothetical protein